MGNRKDELENEKLLHELVRRSEDASPAINQRAYEIIHELAEDRYSDARPVFIDGLGSPDPDYRVACIQALAFHWRDDGDEVTSGLAEMAERDPDAQVRHVSVSALGFLNIGRAATLLAHISENDAEEMWIREAAYEAMLRVSEGSAQSTLPQQRQAKCQSLISELRHLNSQTSNTQNASRLQLVQSLADSHCLEAAELLVDGLADKDSDYRAACMSSLSILQRWHGLDQRSDRAAISYIGAEHYDKFAALEERIVHTLLSIVDGDPDLRVRYQAALSLGSGTFKSEESMPYLRDIVNHHEEHPVMWKNAYLAILEMRDRVQTLPSTLDKLTPDDIDGELLASIDG